MTCNLTIEVRIYTHKVKKERDGRRKLCAITQIFIRFLCLCQTHCNPTQTIPSGKHRSPHSIVISITLCPFLEERNPIALSFLSSFASFVGPHISRYSPLSFFKIQHCLLRFRLFVSLLSYRDDISIDPIFQKTSKPEEV